LVFEEERDVVGGFDVVDCYYLLGFDLTEHGDFVGCGLLQGLWASTCDLGDVRDAISDVRGD
jgi:hypothetical protein